MAQAAISYLHDDADVSFDLRRLYIKTKLLYNFSGDDNDVDRNHQCTGLVSFKDFIGSAVCYSNPLKTGRYLGILTTQGRQTLSLCEVEVYSRGK